jgi:hypothetical protein
MAGNGTLWTWELWHRLNRWLREASVELMWKTMSVCGIALRIGVASLDREEKLVSRSSRI